MTDYLNPDKIYPDDTSRRIDNPPGFDSVRQGGRTMSREGSMTSTEDYIVFDRAGDPHVVVAVDVEVEG